MSRTDSRVDVSEPPWKVVLKADEPLDHSVTSKYLKIVEEEDKHIFESVAETADKTVIFIGLFSAAVAVLVAVSIQDLSPSSQFYLQQLVAGPTGNVSQVTAPSPVTSPLPFSPPPHAIWVNSLWFLSLSISLVCGVLVTSQQHWIHSYMMVTQAPQIPPRRRARIHAFRFRGIMNSGFFMAFDITGILIHISLFLFFIGLLIYLFNINPILFYAVVWFLGASAMAYLIVALMPIYRIDSPYGSPLSFLLYWPFSGALYAILRILKSVIPAGNIASEHFHRLKTIYSEGFATAFLESALEPSPNIECQIMDRTIDILDDRELEWAFERFCDISFSSSSTIVSSIQHLAKSKWSSALEAFSDITFSSDSLLESDRIRRLGLCMKVADLAQLPNAGLHILRQIFDRQHPVLQSIEMRDTVRWNRSNQEIGFCTQILVSGTIANIPSEDRDGRWIALASDLLGKSEDEIRGYRDRSDDNVLFANLIHITRQIIRSWKHGLGQGEAHDAFTYIFRSLSNFDIRNTLPGLQHEFLALWNEINHTEIRDDLRNLRDNALAAPPVPDLSPPGHPPDSIPLPPSPVANHPTAEPNAGFSPGGTSGVTQHIAQSTASSHSHTNPADSTSSQGTSPANLPHSPSPVPGHPTSHPGNGAPPGGASDRSLSQPVTPPTMSRHSPPEPLERHGATPGNIADTLSRGHPGSGTESPRASPSVPPSFPSSAASQVASVSDPNGTSQHTSRAHDLNVPIKAKSFHTPRQSGPSAEIRD
ncbi:hypothetical protein BGW80DRAFT_923098 [Lactifluus volemus]|nr:hypothetical protein BGW80DRAFT_923098 [Lactifluus volemus]